MGDRALKNKLNELTDIISRMNNDYLRIIEENKQLKEEFQKLQENNTKTIQAEIKIMNDIFLYGHSVAIDKMKEKIKIFEERLYQLENK